MNCRICFGPAEFFSQATILKKHRITYFKCKTCGFVQTEEPYWLSEAYANAINRSDVGLVGRNIRLSQLSKMIIFAFFDMRKNFIDYGGGYGLLVRLMRDAGFDFYHFDKYCDNLFAKGFETGLEGNEHFELLTAFEIFEHLVDPIEEVQKMLKFSHHILFTTELLPTDTPLPGNWWYYCLDHGQHISFFTRKSLLVVAERFGLNFYSNGKSVHMLSFKKIIPFCFDFVANPVTVSLFNLILRRKSLIARDYSMITGQELS